MSGGVDSSLAAALIKSQGYDVIGVTLRLLSANEDALNRKALKGIEDAEKVARILDIPHQVFDAREEFEQKVVQPFSQEYLSGRTPNPCVYCNRNIKFGALLAHARKMGAEHVATGHYARVMYDEEKGRFLLKKGKDARKDQSYFLFSLSQDQLRSVIFPLGELTKTEVKERAKEYGLGVFERKESQEICFIPDNDYKKFIKNRFPEAGGNGPIVATDGALLGRHHGIFSFTIGQRKGLNIAKGHPLYVVSLDKDTNTVFVGRKEETGRKELTASRVNWIATESLREPLTIKARIRYRNPENPARVLPLSKETVRVEFFGLQVAITPGQAVVFYEEDSVVGGGWID